MRNSILAKTIQENQLLNLLAVQINGLNRQLAQANNQQVAQQLRIFLR